MGRSSFWCLSARQRTVLMKLDPSIMTKERGTARWVLKKKRRISKGTIISPPPNPVEFVNALIRNTMTLAKYSAGWIGVKDL